MYLIKLNRLNAKYISKIQFILSILSKVTYVLLGTKINYLIKLVRTVKVIMKGICISNELNHGTM